MKFQFQATGASIQVASEMLPNSTERAVTISGICESLIACMHQICQILLESPPKGATIPYRPKPSINPLLLATSAAAAAAAAQQQMVQSNGAYATLGPEVSENKEISFFFPLANLHFPNPIFRPA